VQILGQAHPQYPVPGRTSAPLMGRTC
jgi:hypothetical protein